MTASEVFSYGLDDSASRDRLKQLVGFARIGQVSLVAIDLDPITVVAFGISLLIT